MLADMRGNLVRRGIADTLNRAAGQAQNAAARQLGKEIGRGDRAQSAQHEESNKDYTCTTAQSRRDARGKRATHPSHGVRRETDTRRLGCKLASDPLH